VAVATVAANILIGASAAIVFLAQGVMNPDFVAHSGDFMMGSGAHVRCGSAVNSAT